MTEEAVVEELRVEEEEVQHRLEVGVEEEQLQRHQEVEEEASPYPKPHSKPHTHRIRVWPRRREVPSNPRRRRQQLLDPYLEVLWRSLK
jgi:hypothetical protein